MRGSVIVMGNWTSIKGNKYKKINDEGYCNAILSTTPIEMGKEEHNILKNTFIKPERVYARCYFPEPVGEVKGENFYHELWIDGNLVKTTYYKQSPDPDLDQIQVWISEDEYESQIDSLETGQHDLVLWVIKQEFRGMEKVIEKDLSGNKISREREVWLKKRLSKGKFSYQVK